MSNYKSIVLIVWLFIGVTSSFAQFTTDKRLIEEHMRYSSEKKFNRWDIMVGYGPNIHFTDFTNYMIIPDGKWYFSPSVAVSYQLLPALAFDLRFMQSNLGEKGILHYYDGDFMEFTGSARFYVNQMLPNPGPLNDKWNFYVNVGFGMQALRNRVYKNDNGEVLHGTDVVGIENEGYFVFGYDKNDPNKKVSRKKELVLPIGAGVLYRINRSFDIGIESNIHNSLEDNLDGILSGATNDSYWHTTINLSYKIGKKDKRHSKWTYRTYGFNLFGNKRKDPLEDEVNQFERMLQQQAGILRLQIDSVTTEENSTKIYMADNVFPIYFMPGGATFKDYENQVTMAQLAVLIRKHPEWTLQIEGFAETSEDNPMFVSQKRAETVMEYMIAHYGMDEKIMTVVPRGAKEQLTSPDEKTKEGRIHIDRRVDIVLIKPKIEVEQ